MKTFGPRVYRFRWVLLAGWLAAAGLGALAPRLDPAANEPAEFLPDDCDHSRAVAALRECFPHSTGLSEAVVVFERRDGRLTPEDRRTVEAVAAAIGRADPPRTREADLAGVTVRSPASIPLPANPLLAPDGRAALIVANVPATFVTVRSARVVDHVRAVAAAAKRPAGLAVSVTGSSGFGHDYAEAGKRSHERIGYVTLVAVVVILLLVYRAPLAALVPLAAISTAAYVAMRVLAVGEHLGMHVGTGERIFVFALIYGAGMDYSLLFISRFREFLDAGSPPADAVGGGLNATFAAILASAATDTLGLLMLCAARYGVFRTAGLAVAAALIVALLAAVTLVPGMVGVFGRRLFWPTQRMGHIGGRRLWPWVARRVTARPGRILLVTLALLVVPAVPGATQRWVYDALAELDPAAPDGVGNAPMGIAAAKRHWPVGQIAPVSILLVNDRPLSDAQWQAAARKLTDAVTAVDGVEDVRSLTQPVGRRADVVSRAMLAAAGAATRPEYLCQGPPAMRLLAVLDQPALTLRAMETVARVRGAVAEAARAAGLNAAVHLAGATAQMIDIRKVTGADFRRIAVLVLAVIFVMVLGLLRDAVLAGFMVFGTVLSYFATLGLTRWAFAAAGAGGLDWKVEVFLFVVMVAVGVDYSIFLAARVRQEARLHPIGEATARAVIHTGPVISSCGVIMAATLGSLMAGDLKLFQQLGLAMALGMLMDTFLVRPLLLPAFIALTGRGAHEPP